MAFVLEPTAPIGTELPRVVRKRLRQAIRMLESVDHERPSEIDRTVHEVRKRTKEVRSAARLVRHELGDHHDRFDGAVKEAAALLSPIRDAYVMWGTFERLAAPSDLADHAPASTAPDPSDLGVEGVAGVAGVAERIAAATTLLKSARSQTKKWKVSDDFDTLGIGLRESYRRGRKRLRQLERSSDDEVAHAWRRAVKSLWYQLRLIERSAPSVLGPFGQRLDELAEALGDDHDLSLLIADLATTPDRYGGAPRADEVRRVAQVEQAALRRRSLRLGASLYAEKTDAFVDRMAAYWACTQQLGVEIDGITVETSAADRGPEDAPRTVERERKFLVSRLPLLPPAGTELRQGYVAVDGPATVRVRDDGVGDPTLTIKAGHGAVRTELEWSISAAEFAAAWPHTEGRRIRKTRYRVPVGEHVAEVDVFHDGLEGLVLVEVEFTSDAAMASFSPPDWFGDDVTDDESFTNASLATHALPGAR